MMKLNELSVGSSGIIEEVLGQGALRQHFLDMGVIPGAKVTVMKLAPLGDPMELRIHGYELMLRLDDARQISVRPVTAESMEEQKKQSRETDFVSGRIADGITKSSSGNRKSKYKLSIWEEKKETEHPGLLPS